jgi:hypothetical protein
MRRPFGITCLFLSCAAAGLHAEFLFKDPEWTIEAEFAAPPKTDNILTPSPQGDVRAGRYFLENEGERSMLIRFAYPLAILPGAEAALYEKSVGEMMKSRPGRLRSHEKYQLGPFTGEQIVVEQPKEKTLREIRLLVVGSCLYVMSAEWPASVDSGAERAARFFGSIKLRADSTDFRVVEERERWRVFNFGRFRLKFDAAHWYRDPGDQEPGVINFLRADEKAEAQLIVEDKPLEGGDIAKSVLDTAKESADSISVKHRGQKIRGAAEVVELEFAAAVGGVTYLNHGYFYTGPQGTVQLRSWAKDQDYRTVADDMTELLEGLVIGGK